MKREKLLKIYLIIISLAIILTGINPADRTVWMLEISLVVLAVIGLIFSYKTFKFSKVSYTLLLILLIGSSIGAMYTYEKVPYEGLKDILGTQRNPYDRIVHFSFGLLVYFPLLEFFVRTSRLKHKFWMYFVPLFTIIGLGAIYEIAEWAVAVNVAPNAAQAFLGMQGDIWDAQKDMLLNSLGAVTSMFITMIKRKIKTGHTRPDF